MLKRMVRPSDGRARGQQHQSIDQRQVPRIKCFNTNRRPNTAGQCSALGLNSLTRIQADIEISPEPSNEEHNFRSNEQDHAIAMVHLHNRRMVALTRLFYHIAPPGQHRVQNTGQADYHNPWRAIMEKLHSTNRQQQNADRGHYWPWAWVYQMIVVIFCVTVSHNSIPSVKQVLPAQLFATLMPQLPPQRMYKTK